MKKNSMTKSETLFLRYLKYFAFAVGIMAFVVGFTRSPESAPQKLVVVETNDSHSAVLPMDEQGGYAARFRVIDSLRQVHPNLVLVDDGDIFQGTPFFNLFGGSLDIACYNLMGYDAMTLGNHEFDIGIDSLAKILKKAEFPVVVSNYDVKGTPLEDIVQKYAIINRGSLKIGLFGLGVAPDNLIIPDNFGGITYLDPIKTANHYAQFLREQEQCDFVLCISHLGFAYEKDHPFIGDSILATKTRNIDLITGGHTHGIVVQKFINNADGVPTMVGQERKNAKYLGLFYIAEKEDSTSNLPKCK